MIKNPKKYQLLILADSDLRLASNIAGNILNKGYYDTRELNEGFEHLVYTTSLLIYYGRPFKVNRKNSSERKFIENLLTSLSPVQIELHQDLITYRDKAFAHTDLHEAKLSELNGGMFPSIKSPDLVNFGISRDNLFLLLRIISVLLERIYDLENEIRSKLTSSI